MRKNKKNKTVIMLLVLGLLVIGTGTAAILNYFGKTTTTVDVKQAVTLSGDGCDNNLCSESMVAYGGETTTSQKRTINSLTGVNAPVRIDTTSIPSEGTTSIIMYDLQVTTDEPAGTEKRIHLTPIGISTLGDINSITFTQNASEGYMAHADVLLDLNNDGIYTSGIDDALVFEYAKVAAPYDNTPYPLGVFNTFGEKGMINNNAEGWLTSGDAGNHDSPTYYYATLGDWKAGLIKNGKTISSASKVLAIQVEVDNWITGSRAQVSDLKVNGVAVNPTIQPKGNLDFEVKTNFSILANDTYTVQSTLNIQ